MNPDDRRILIVTGEGDVHGQAVAWGLRTFGMEVTIWKWSNFPRMDTTCWHIDSNTSPSLEFDINGSAHNSTFDVIWNRRQVLPIPLTSSHVDDAKVIIEESTSYLRSVLPFLGTKDTFWVNTIEASRRADNKIYQLYVAKRLGFRIPATLIGNNPVKAKEFFDRHRGRVVFKPFQTSK